MGDMWVRVTGLKPEDLDIKPIRLQKCCRNSNNILLSCLSACQNYTRVRDRGECMVSRKCRWEQTLLLSIKKLLPKLFGSTETADNAAVSDDAPAECRKWEC